MRSSTLELGAAVRMPGKVAMVTVERERLVNLEIGRSLNYETAYGRLINEMALLQNVKGGKISQ